jgi:hypothetical protein
MLMEAASIIKAERQDTRKSSDIIGFILQTTSFDLVFFCHCRANGNCSLKNKYNLSV